MNFSTFPSLKKPFPFNFISIQSICFTLSVCMFQIGIIRILWAVQISAFYVCCGIGKETVFWFSSDAQVSAWTGTEESTIRFEWRWGEGVLERQQAAPNSMHCSSAGSDLTWPLLQKPGCVFTTVCEADMAEMGSAWDTWGSPAEACEGTEMEIGPDKTGEEAGAGWMSYDALVGSLVSAVWK